MSVSWLPRGPPMVFSTRSCRSTSESRPDEDAEVTDERPVHPERMGLDEFEYSRSALDRFFAREHDRQMAAAWEDFRKRVEGARVESVDRLASRRRGASVRRICRDSVDPPRPQREPPGICNSQIGSSSRGPEGLPRPHDHLALPVDADAAKSQLRGLQEDP